MDKLSDRRLPLTPEHCREVSPGLYDRGSKRILDKALPFALPPPPGYTGSPIWSGSGFQVDDSILPMLSYEISSSGWTDDLTRFHEETAGSSHFIDRASRQHALEQLARHVKGPSPVILDVGCSSGFMLLLARQHLPHAIIIGSDYIRGPLEQLAADMPDIPLLHFDLIKCPLPENSIDAVILLNVLEHIADDATAVRQVYRILKPGGIAVIEVPAGPHLYDIYDKLLLHCRRYSLPGLRHLLKSASFSILEQSHLGFFLYPGFWLVKQRNKRYLRQKDFVRERIVAQNIRTTKNNLLLNGITRLELLLGRWFSFPFGIRCLVTSCKPG